MIEAAARSKKPEAKKGSAEFFAPLPLKEFVAGRALPVKLPETPSGRGCGSSLKNRAAEFPKAGNLRYPSCTRGQIFPEAPTKADLSVAAATSG